MSNTGFTINKAVLPNGLKIIHSFNGTTAMAAVNLLYNVGTRDESRDLTGMAHLFEHLMFGGSVNVDNFDGVLTSAGGVNNAWTSSDFTNFYETVPTQNIETAFYLESDRMLSLSFNEKSLEVQRGVVIEEFKQTCLDVPYGDCMHRLRRLTYAPEHPYSWPTIGLTPEHIEKVTMQNVKDWFFAHYAPNNTILAVTGNVTFDKVMSLAEKWFGDIPAREIKPRILPSPGFPIQNVVENVNSQVPVPMLFMSIPMDVYGTKSYYSADAITDLLSSGRSARFNNKVIYGVGKGLIINCDASIIGSEHEGMLLISARLNDKRESSFKEATEILINAGAELAEPGNISDTEHQRCFNIFESDFRFSNKSYLSMAQNLASCEYHSKDINSIVSDRRNLNVEDIATEANKLFNKTPRIVLNYGIE